MEMAIVAPDGGARVGERARILYDTPEIAIVEFDYPRLRRGPDRHVHHHHGDGFLVISGELTFLLGPEPEEVAGGPGTIVFSPPGVAHTFRNDLDGSTRVINIHVPGCDFGAYMLGRNPDFDQHEPPADGGLPLSDAIIRRDARAEHALISAEVVTPAAGWRGSGCFYVLDGLLRVGDTELPPRGFAAGVEVEVPDGAPGVTFLHLEPH